MLSKILCRSGLSRLFWIKDAVSHRLDGCVLELVWAAFVLIWGSCEPLSTRSLLPGCYLVALCLRSRRFRSRLPFTNLIRVSRFCLLVKPFAFRLLHLPFDPSGRRQPLGQQVQQLYSNGDPYKIALYALAQAFTAPQSLKSTQDKRKTFVPGRMPLKFLLQCLGFVYG